MKFLICFLAVISLFASVHGWNKIEHTTGKELLHILEGGYYQDGGLHRVYVIMFYNPGVGSENLQAKNNEYRQAIKTQVLDKWPNVYYTEVDATNTDYVRFSEDVIGVNTAELQEMSRDEGVKRKFSISKISNSLPNVYYTEVDATNADYVRFSEDVVGVNTAELIHAPSILIMEYGQGVWIHGPEAVSRIARYVPAYEERSRVSRH